MLFRKEALFSQIAVLGLWFLSETNPDLLQQESDCSPAQQVFAELQRRCFSVFGIKYYGGPKLWINSEGSYQAVSEVGFLSLGQSTQLPLHSLWLRADEDCEATLLTGKTDPGLCVPPRFLFETSDFEHSCKL